MFGDGCVRDWDAKTLEALVDAFMVVKGAHSRLESISGMSVFTRSFLTVFLLKRVSLGFIGFHAPFARALRV